MKRMMLCLLIALSYVAVQAQSEVKLEDKRFSPNWFSDLEKAKANPDKVFYLDLSLQKLKVFPTEIFQFKNLKELHLSYNYWPTVPEGWGALTQLELLDLSGNYYLNKLPTDLGKLKSLKELDLKDNKLNKGEADKASKALPNAKVLVK